MTGVIRIALALGLGQSDQPVLDMDAAIQIAERNAFSIQTQNANLEKLRQSINQAKAGLFPSVTLNGSVNHFDKVFGGPQDQESVNLQIAQSIDIMGNVNRGVRASRHSMNAGELNVATARNDLRRDVGKSYISVLKASALVSVQRETLKDQDATEQNTEQQFKAGVVAYVDVLRAKAQQAQAKSDVIAAENNLQLSKEAFNNTLARPISTNFELRDLSDLPTVDQSSEELIAKAQSNRSEVKGLQETLAALKDITKITERGTQPALSVALQPSYNLNPGFAAYHSSYVAALSLSFPLWDGGATRAKVKSARQDEELTRIQLKQVLLGISLEVSQALTNLRNIKARLAVSEDQVKFAQENFRLAQLRYKAGEGISLEVTDAEAALAQARVGLVNARYDYLSAYVDLTRALGGAPTPEAHMGTDKK